MSEAHGSPYTVHPRGTKMYRDVNESYGWNNMKRDIVKFVEQCPTCQQVKVKHPRPAGTLKPLLIPKWKWGEIAMNFILELPKTPNGEDSIWVVVNHLTKSAHFIPMKVKDLMDKLARHGVPSSIISDRDLFYLEILVKSPKRNGDGVEVQYRFPSSDRWSV